MRALSRRAAIPVMDGSTSEDSEPQEPSAGLLYALGRDPSPLPGTLVAWCTGILQQVRERRGPFRSLAVTSTVRGEGRSTVAVGLAVANATRINKRTILLDLTDYQGAKETLSATGVQQVHEPKITWVTDSLGTTAQGGPHPGSSADGVAELLDALPGDADVVAVLPPLPPSGPGDVLTGPFDAVAMVVRAGRTPRQAVELAAATLGRPPLVILNRTGTAVPRWFPWRQPPYAGST